MDFNGDRKPTCYLGGHLVSCIFMYITCIYIYVCVCTNRHKYTHIYILYINMFLCIEYIYKRQNIRGLFIDKQIMVDMVPMVPAIYGFRSPVIYGMSTFR